MTRLEKHRFILVVALFLYSSLSAAENAPVTVNLTVKDDGREVAPPEHITLSADRRSMRIPIRDGRFEVPHEFVSAKRVTFSATVSEEQVRITNIDGEKFTENTWTLFLAARRFEAQYQWSAPKGSNVRSSCVLVFESPNTEPGTYFFIQHCRSKRNH